MGITALIAWVFYNSVLGCLVLPLIAFLNTRRMKNEAGEDFSPVDRGQLEQDPNDADQYYAQSSDFEGDTYDMHTPAEKDTFWWGG